MVYSDTWLLPANVAFDATFRQALGASPGEPIDCFGEFLDEVRFPANSEERMRDLLRAKYGERPPDVIVAFSPPSLGFCLRDRSQLFPQVPIVFAAVGADGGGETDLGPRVTGVRPSFDGPATLRLALRLHPRTKQVFLVAGPVGLDSTALGLEWSTFRESAFGTTFQYLTGQPLPQLLEKLSQLPENSLAIYSSLFRSGAGYMVSRQEAVERMAEVSRAPLYGPFDALVGSGLVGAVATPIDTIARQTAELVVQILSPETADPFPAVRTLAATPIFDWRQLRRWGIHKSQLPPGSIVRFEPPSFWRRHLGLVVTVGGLFLLQTGLILALVLQGRRRHVAEREARQRRDELAHLTRVATVGELTASLAHEINQPLAAILSNAQAALRLLAAGEANTDEIREILVDIADDDQRAGEVIRRMRAMLRKGESSMTRLDVNDVVAEVVGLVRGEMILHDVTLGLQLAHELPVVHGDRVQLQQVLLNLLMNALEAMKETSSFNRKVVVRTAASDGPAVLVSVTDSGIGVSPDKLEQVFEPFVTTKPHGMGLGLVICRSIVQAHGGRIGSTNSATRGATFWFTLPAMEEVQP